MKHQKTGTVPPRFPFGPVLVTLAALLCVVLLG